MSDQNLQQKTIQKLKEHNLYAKKKLGQNFLISQKALNQILQASNPQPQEQILEIGPGTGNLTQELLQSNIDLTVVEKDSDMLPILTELQKHQPFRLINADGLHLPFQELNLKTGYKVIANIPYYITSPLINKFLKYAFINENPTPKSLTLMVQLEVAEKICDQNKLNVLRANIIAFGDTRIVAKVPASKFYPAPKVDSAIIHIDVSPSPKVNCDLQKFFKIILASFGSRRKTLKNNLKSLAKAWEFDLQDLSQQTKIDLSKRAEALSLQDFEKITNYITTHTS